ncbi:MAG: pyruvate kinase [Patescibacteria group bacterium]|nr:pyruvate kinase [Patescibacteria group bacterium]
MKNILYPAHSLKRTKIVATIGPASDSSKIIEKLIKNGLNVARLNFSHGTHETHLANAQKIREASKKLGKPVAILQDLQGPKIRLGILSEEKINLKKGQIVTFYHANLQIDNRIPIQVDIFPYLEKNNHILINDGLTRLSVISVNKQKKEAVCEVKVANPISSKKGINLPDTKLPTMSLTQKDIEDLKITEKLDADYVALSFVQSIDDIYALRKILGKMANPPKIIVKLETKEAVKNLESLIKESDAVMVARGDLAIEIDPENVPIVQKQVIKLARKHHTPVIIATQMLESMVNNPEPTRAEVNDVATAVLDRVDAIMLSAETATGNYPVEAVAMQKRIIKRVEKHYHESSSNYALDALEESTDQTTGVAAAACILAHQLKASLIIVVTSSGKTAARVASYRPTAPIIGITDNAKTLNQLTLLWGVKAFRSPDYKTDFEIFEFAKLQITKLGYVQKGDKIVFVSGQKPHQPGSTNTISVFTI